MIYMIYSDPLSADKYGYKVATSTIITTTCTTLNINIGHWPESSADLMKLVHRNQFEFRL